MSDFVWIYVPTVFTVWMLMIACISMYSVDHKHEANLAALGRQLVQYGLSLFMTFLGDWVGESGWVLSESKRRKSNDG